MSDRQLGDAHQVHLIGIGGAGMSALATLLLQMGKQVSGSELASSPTVEAVRSSGGRIMVGHAAEQVGQAQYVVRSSAIGDDNVEVQEARRRGLPVRKLAEAVGELMIGRAGVAVAGTHGKTTTTSLVAWLLERGGLDPLVLIGADTPSFPQGAHLGEGPMVVEADEYDRRFLSYWPEVAVVTSIEPDHLDYYHDLAEIRATFVELVDRLPEHGRLVVCADEPTAAGLSSGRARRETYGFADDADWRIEAYQAVDEGGSRFTLRSEGRAWSVDSPLVGEHNARNVTAAIAVADHFGVGLRAALAAVPSFQSPRRRFETRGWPGGIRVVDDYAHHPTEVRAMLQAARGVTRGQVWVIFQPHTTNRTAALFDEFARSFDGADHALVLPIYRPSGRETAPRPVASPELVAAMQQAGHPDARFVDGFGDALTTISEQARAGDTVITMGAGDVTRLADDLLAALSR